MNQISGVTLVIPGRDCAHTVRACLDSVVPLANSGEISEIVFVDDASKDNTANILASYPVTVLVGEGKGAGAARNIGWRYARTDLIWFVDSDCVAQPGALQNLVPLLADHRVGAAGGSYTNMLMDRLLPTLIQEEIEQRHIGMKKEVSFLATFNVLYRRHVLEQVNGFDERFLKGQDAELAYRVRKKGWILIQENSSKVGHFHLDRLMPYLRIQAKQGFWRMWLYRLHPERMSGDSYASKLDYVQPPLAMLIVASLPLLYWSGWPTVILVTLLICAQCPFAIKMFRRTRRAEMLWYIGLGFVRSFARGFGMSLGMLSVLTDQHRSLMLSQR